MKDFPKKYNYNIVEKEIQEKNKKKQSAKSAKNLSYMFSSPIPISEQLHLWNIFSVVYYDVLTKFLDITWKNIHGVIGFYKPSQFKSTKISQIEKFNHKLLFNKQKINQKQINHSWNYSSFDNYSTINEDYINNVRQIFIDFYKKWIIYEDKKIVYWSNQYQSVIWNDDVEQKMIHWKKYNIRYFIETKNDSIIISTTNPETIFSDVAFLVHPNDKRYKKFIWSNVLIPIINKPIPIIADDTVDTMLNNGIVRVTPSHDFVWLQLAQKHKLPSNIWSIDDKWCFTHVAWIFANKKVEDFFDNIIQYLDDISNLNGIVDFDYTIPVFKKTWEKLILLQKKQRFINISDNQKQNIIQSINNSVPKIISQDYLECILDWINNADTRCISRQYNSGQAIPVRENTRWSTYIVDEIDIVEKLIKSRKSRKVILTLIIFNLILDWHLSLEFSIDRLVDVLFSKTLQSDQRVIDYYIQKLQSKLNLNPKTKKYLSEIKELKKITDIIDMTRKSSFEKIQLLLDILKKSYLIDNIQENYIFNLSILFEDRYKIWLQKSVFDTSFLRSLWTIYYLWINKDNKHWSILCTWSDNIDRVIKTFIINMYFYDKLPFSDVYIHQLILNEKLNNISDLDKIAFDTRDIFKINGKDAFRLSFIINWKDDNFKYSVSNLKDSSRFLDKLWNASRFIFKNFVNHKKKLNLATLKKEIEKNSDMLHETDFWIIHIFKDLLTHIDSNISQWTIVSLGDKVVNITKKYFCDRYLEIIKENKTPHTPSVVVYHLMFILKLLYPYIPHISQKIVDSFGLDIDDLDMSLFDLNTDNIHKNYKVHLLFDIMDKIVEIRENNCLKQHESIDIFLQANTDFIELIENYEVLLKKLLRINNIEYIRPHQALPSWYTIDSVINITLWVKTKKVCSEKEYLNQLKSEMEDKEYHLQNIRNILYSYSSSNKEDKLKKEKEMKKLKKEILEIEYKINKIKMLK